MKLPESFELRRAMLSIQVLDHPMRRQIINLLSENRDLSVKEIQYDLRIPQSATSQHLAKLRRAGYLDSRREGKEVRYSLKPDVLLADISHINALSK